MALPKLDVPTFELELPTTGKKVKYRPFLVKEHKMLLMLQDADVDAITKIITDLIDVCTFKKLNINELASVDIEYLFLNIRAKSISESYDFLINCECGEKYEVQADIDNITIERDEKHTNKVLITNDIGFEMKYPSFNTIVNVYNSTNAEDLFDLIVKSIKAVYTPESYEEITKDNMNELKEMIDALTKEQFEKVEKFFETMPRLLQKVEGTCPKCSKVSEVEIRGLENFFG